MAQKVRQLWCATPKTNAHALLAQHDLKMLIIACNTASAVALAPTATVGYPRTRRDSARRSGSTWLTPERIAVLGTRGTLNAGAYDRELKNLGFSGESFTSLAHSLSHSQKKVGFLERLPKRWRKPI